MAKYHINPASGRPNICSAQTPEGCKFAKPDVPPPPHYASKDEARAAYDASNKDKVVAAGVSKKGEKKDRSDDDSLESRQRKVAEKYPYAFTRYAESPTDSSLLNAQSSTNQDGVTTIRGGKLDEALYALGKRSLDGNDVVNLIRSDLDDAVRKGELPSDLMYRVKKEKRGARIIVSRNNLGNSEPLDKSFFLREPDLDRALVMRQIGAPQESYLLDESTAMANAVADEEGSKLPRAETYTDEYLQTSEYLNELAGQWQYSRIDRMSDQDIFLNQAMVSFESKRRDNYDSWI